MSLPLAAGIPRRRPVRALTLLLGLAIGVAACGGSAEERAGTPDTAATAEPQASAAPAESRTLDWCALLPVQEVSATLQRTIGKGVSVAKPSAGGGCTYRDVEQGVPDVQLLVELVDMDSDSAAAGSMDVVRGMFTDRGQAVSDVAGIGDAAFGAWEAETYGLKLRAGRHGGQVNVNARRFRDPAVERAAQELAKQMVAKLP